MVRQLKENERLVYAGEATLRAPDGIPLPAVPQYMIVPADEADPTAVVELRDNERIVLGGRIFNDMKLAKERYAAYKAGREVPPREEGIPIYFIVDAVYINPKTGRTYEDEKACAMLGKDLAALIAIQKRKEKAAERLKSFRE